MSPVQDAGLLSTNDRKRSAILSLLVPMQKAGQPINLDQ